MEPVSIFCLFMIFGYLVWVIWKYIRRDTVPGGTEERVPCLKCGRLAHVLSWETKRFYSHYPGPDGKPDMCMIDFAGDAVDEEAPGIGDS